MEDLKPRLAAYRFVAYSAVIFSVIAVLSICITLPMVYNYIHHVKKSLRSDIKFCRGSARDIWDEVNFIQNSPPANRTRRQADPCAQCCLPGPAGPRGTCRKTWPTWSTWSPRNARPPWTTSSDPLRTDNATAVPSLRRWSTWTTWTCRTTWTSWSSWSGRSSSSQPSWTSRTKRSTWCARKSWSTRPARRSWSRCRRWLRWRRSTRTCRTTRTTWSSWTRWTPCSWRRRWCSWTKRSTWTSWNARTSWKSWCTWSAWCSWTWWRAWNLSEVLCYRWWCILRRWQLPTTSLDGLQTELFTYICSIHVRFSSDRLDKCSKADHHSHHT
ncbi:nematode cuticle collagen domain protein [Cooperia oncophora]